MATVKEIIEQLSKLPQDARVHIIYDGEPRMPLETIYLSKSGHVMATSGGQRVYTDKYTPVDNIGVIYDTPKLDYNTMDDLDF